MNGHIPPRRAVNIWPRVVTRVLSSPSGLEPEIQKLISRHKQELKKLRTLHEAELLQADDRVAQRYVRQCEELRLQLEREKEEQCHRERELAKQRWARGHRCSCLRDSVFEVVFSMLLLDPYLSDTIYTL